MAFWSGGVFSSAEYWVTCYVRKCVLVKKRFENENRMLARNLCERCDNGGENDDTNLL